MQRRSCVRTHFLSPFSFSSLFFFLFLFPLLAIYSRTSTRAGINVPECNSKSNRNISDFHSFAGTSLRRDVQRTAGRLGRQLQQLSAEEVTTSVIRTLSQRHPAKSSSSTSSTRRNAKVCAHTVTVQSTRSYFCIVQAEVVVCGGIRWYPVYYLGIW